MRFLFALWLLCAQLVAGTFSVATYNLEFYVDQPVLNGIQPKSDPAKRAVRAAIKAVNADVLALQEVGSTNALLELRATLQNEGLKYPFWEHVKARDTAIHLAFLSKHPITARRHHTSESYLHQGRRFYVARGFGQVEVELAKNFRVTLMTAHLKSKRLVAEADQEELREEEALLLRERVNEFFKENPTGNLVVLGDLNDGVYSRTLRTILGRGKTGLFDTRPSEGERREGQARSAVRFRDVVWTHYYAKEESYSRLDYILISPALKNHWDAERTFILDHPDWGIASDHRPLVASFHFN